MLYERERKRERESVTRERLGVRVSERVRDCGDDGSGWPHVPKEF